MRRYKELSRYRPVVSVTVQALIKVSQPIARGERNGSNQRSPTQSLIVSKPNFGMLHRVIEPPIDVMSTIKLFDILSFFNHFLNFYLPFRKGMTDSYSHLGLHL